MCGSAAYVELSLYACSSAAAKYHVSPSPRASNSAVIAESIADLVDQLEPLQQDEPDPRLAKR